MNVVLPPVLFYVVGGLLVIFGALRAAKFGLRKSRRELFEDNPAARKQRRYHLVVGILWVVMGAFLICSTAGFFRSVR